MATCSPHEIGRRRRARALELLAAYGYLTGDQLARAVWGGRDRLARRHLLRGVQEGIWRRLPHPLDRSGCYIYTLGRRSTMHSQQVLHCLAKAELHVSLMIRGATVLPESPWGRDCVPDQTVIWRGTVWAVEHHLSGQFTHLMDYRRCLEEASYEDTDWWQEGLQIGLLILPSHDLGDHVRRAIQRTPLRGTTIRVVELAAVVRNPALWLQIK